MKRAHSVCRDVDPVAMSHHPIQSKCNDIGKRRVPTTNEESSTDESNKTT